jgi:hypothetical protein
MERINLVRGKKGKILSLTYDKSATLGLGTDMAVVEPADHATFFRGSNAYGRALIAWRVQGERLHQRPKRSIGRTHQQRHHLPHDVGNGSRLRDLGGRRAVCGGS